LRASGDDSRSDTTNGSRDRLSDDGIGAVLVLIALCFADESNQLYKARHLVPFRLAVHSLALVKLRPASLPWVINLTAGDNPLRET
jgi:hypothetical protein